MANTLCAIVHTASCVLRVYFTLRLELTSELALPFLCSQIRVTLEFLISATGSLGSILVESDGFIVLNT